MLWVMIYSVLLCEGLVLDRLVHSVQSLKVPALEEQERFLYRNQERCSRPKCIYIGNQL